MAGKSKKLGRNKVPCAAYKASGKQEVNKAKRLLRHLNSCTGIDKSAIAAYKAMSDTHIKRARALLTSSAKDWHLPN